MDSVLFAYRNGGCNLPCSTYRYTADDLIRHLDDVILPGRTGAIFSEAGAVAIAGVSTFANNSAFDDGGDLLTGNGGEFTFFGNPFPFGKIRTGPFWPATRGGCQPKHHERYHNRRKVGHVFNVALPPFWPETSQFGRLAPGSGYFVASKKPPPLPLSLPRGCLLGAAGTFFGFLLKAESAQQLSELERMSSQLIKSLVAFISIRKQPHVRNGTSELTCDVCTVLTR